MKNGLLGLLTAAIFVLPMSGQTRRLWVLRTGGEMVEYNPTTFVAKQTVKVPPEASQSPQNLSINSLGQMLFATPVSLPVSEADVESPHKAWFWNGHTAVMIDQGMIRTSANQGSNLVVNESAPVPYLSADGTHLYWFANQARRLQREDVDLSTTTTWQAWRTDLSGGTREDLLSLKFPECHCSTGSCEETCPSGVVWVPEGGVGRLFLMTQFVAGQTQSNYKSTVLYRETGGKWISSDVMPPVRRMLDLATDGNLILEAVPDTGCCGWVNQSNDQTLLRSDGKNIVVFDEQKTYKNPDYDVSFYTSTAQLSPELGYVGLTVMATAQPNKTIQLAHEGQANPEESQQIRKSLAELPLVDVKTTGDSPRSVAHLPHAAVVGWLSERELLIVTDQVVVAYNIQTGARRKSTIHVQDSAHVFLR